METESKIVSKPTNDLYRDRWDLAFNWIPVTDTMPETNQPVKVKTSAGEIFEAFLIQDTLEWQERTTGNLLLLNNITHWKLLS